jgi:hypothetical protein
MQIKKFKLINDGYDGIKVSYAEAIKVNKAAAIDVIDRTRNLPVPITLKAKIAGLTYFFLNLTRHWVAPFNKFFNLTTYDLNPIEPNSEMSQGEGILRALWNDTTITGASISNGDIILTGKINVFGDKVMGLSTATICAEDDFGFYEELKTRLDEIADDIGELMEQKDVILDAKQMMFSFPDVEEGEELTADELAEKMLEKLSDKGVVILEPGPAAIGDGKKNEGLKESKAPIDKENIPEAEPASDVEANATQEQQDKIGSESESTLASEGDDVFDKAAEDDDPTKIGSDIPKGAEGGDLSQYEHSGAMGDESEPNPDDEEPWSDD